jgi:hypothetical protein
MRNKVAFANAFDLWAEARERTVIEVSQKAAALATQGRDDEAEHFRFVARLLTVRVVHERAQAAALRAADKGSTPDRPSPAHVPA